MNTKRTPGTWSQGRTLRTRQTERWTPEEIARNDQQEARMVFANFSALDEGRGRIRVAICERAEDAKVMAAVPALIDALQAYDMAVVALMETGAVKGLPEPAAEALRAACRTGLMAHAALGDPPGQAPAAPARHPWEAFLTARADAIDWMRDQGDSDRAIAATLSMDADQVMHIRTRQREGDKPAA